jgi:hypothetical protein
MGQDGRDGWLIEEGDANSLGLWAETSSFLF